MHFYAFQMHSCAFHMVCSESTISSSILATLCVLRNNEFRLLWEELYWAKVQMVSRFSDREEMVSRFSQRKREKDGSFFFTWITMTLGSRRWSRDNTSSLSLFKRSKKLLTFHAMNLLGSRFSALPLATYPPPSPLACDNACFLNNPSRSTALKNLFDHLFSFFISFFKLLKPIATSINPVNMLLQTIS